MINLINSLYYFLFLEKNHQLILKEKNFNIVTCHRGVSRFFLFYCFFFKFYFSFFIKFSKCFIVNKVQWIFIPYRTDNFNLANEIQFYFLFLVKQKLKLRK